MWTFVHSHIIAIILSIITVRQLFSDRVRSTTLFFMVTSTVIAWFYSGLFYNLASIKQFGVIAIWLIAAWLIIGPQKDRFGWVITTMIVMAIAMIFIVGYTPKTPVSQTTPPAAPAVSSADAEWEQWSIDRGNNRLIATGISGNTPQEVLNNKLNLAKHDAVSLVAYAYQARLIDSENIDKVKYLTSDGKYLNSDGRALWYQLKGNLAGTENAITNAPAASINSGTDGTAYVVDSEPGISGDTTALQTKYPNGNVTYTLTRCGNPVYNGDQDIKKGGTDETIDRERNREEEKKKKEEYEEKLEEKSSDPADYKQPGDGSERDSGTGTKPQASVTTTADKKPPTVVKKVTNSITKIVDSSTKAPGTETGVTAPGATAPTVIREPDNIPDPENGANVVPNDSDPGGF